MTIFSKNFTENKDNEEFSAQLDYDRIVAYVISRPSQLYHDVC